MSDAGSPGEEAQLEKVRAAFDAAYYVASYPDVIEAGVDPFEHYMRHGWLEQRDPHPEFSAGFYLDANRDVRESRINPFVHWILYGRDEGRRGTRPPADTAHGLDPRELAQVRAAFDARFYVANYPDVSEARVDPFEHFMNHGWLEARDPRFDFNAAYYLEANRDVRETGINPFVHWVLYGRVEGRRATRPAEANKPRPKTRAPEGHSTAVAAAPPPPEAGALPPSRRLRLAGDARRSVLEQRAPELMRDILAFELSSVEKKAERLRGEMAQLEEEKLLLQRQLGALRAVLAAIDPAD